MFQTTKQIVFVYNSNSCCLMTDIVYPAVMYRISGKIYRNPRINCAPKQFHFIVP